MILKVLFFFFFLFFLSLDKHQDKYNKKQDTHGIYRFCANPRRQFCTDNCAEDKEEKEKNYYRKERSFGSFKRQFNVGNVKENEIDAKFNNGVLKISFPKEEQKQSKKFIAIK